MGSHRVGHDWSHKRVVGLSTEVNLMDSNTRVSLLLYTAAAAKLLQSCLTLRDPIDGSPSGSTVPGILQWVAMSFSSA